MKEFLNFPKNIIHQFLQGNEDGMKQILTWFLNTIMEYEAKIQAGASYYERISSRKAHRNGYRKRSLKTKYGTLELFKPQLREFQFTTQVFDRYSRVEKALRKAVLESYIQGVSTRRVKEIINVLSSEEISPATVSKIGQELDENVKEFLTKPIEEEIPYLFVDASYYKVRDERIGRYKTKALLVVAGVRKDEYREILGLKLAENEGEDFWIELFEEIKRRGLRKVKLIISDGHKGIEGAVKKALTGSSWQMCHVHFVRDVLRKVPKKRWVEITRKLKEALKKVEEMEKLIQELEEEGLKRAVSTCERYIHELYNYQSFPKKHWRRIKTTNMLERVNKELKRRSRVIGAFPSEKSLIRLVVSILIDINEEWLTGRRYLNMEE